MGDASDDPVTSSSGDHDRPGTAELFARVAERLEADGPARSLWQKLEQEIAAGGVLSAMSYLRTRFAELSDGVTTALRRGGHS
ncbi:MAG TPA: hypothetical protein VNL96_10215 [Gemmatimonadaceae bacterium]|nr:hypothetical protein [Gemmatimonadaceae bacterium]